MSTIASRKKSIISTSGVSIEQPVANKNLLNAAASESLYQQCSRLRSKMLQIPSFSKYFALASNDNPRSSTDPVTQLWDCLALGVPLCALYNLRPPPSVPIPVEKIDTDPDNFDPNNDKVRKRAIALFSMYTKSAFPDKETFIVTDLTGTRETSDGFTKIVIIVSAIMNEFPEEVFSEPPSSPQTAAAPSASSDALPHNDSSTTLVTLSGKERDRRNILREMLDTERKYVQDLEVMQKYAVALTAKIDGDTIHHLFPNLRQLLNFQRTFLIRFESIAEVPWPDQRWGLAFMEREQDFLVYEPYCANYNAALELMGTFVAGEMLKTDSDNLEPELHAFLIKPIQRICKYPLLLESLVKVTNKDEYPWYDELVEGAAATKRITEKINEAQRRAENVVAVANLRQRVGDWKGHALANFGDLLLDDLFVVTKSEVDREYHVFLFENIILCCKEVIAVPMSAKKVGKSNSILKKQQQPATPSSAAGGAAAQKSKTTPLLLKGRIFLTNVTQAIPSRTNGGNYLGVYWSGEDDMEHFTLRCRNEEQMTKWEAAINKLIQDVKDRRASERLSSSRVRSMAGEPSPMSRTPSTAYDRGLTMSTVGPSTRSPYTSNGASAGRARPTTPFGEDFANGNFPQNVGSGPAGYPGSEGFINEDTDDYEDYPPALHAAPSGRGTPLGTRRNGSRTPVGYSEEARQSSYTNGGPPPLPHNGLPSGPASRGPMSRQSNPISRMSSTASVSGADGIAGAGRRPGGLRSQFSSTRLNSQYEQNNGNGDVPSLPPAQRNGAPIGPTRSRSASQPQAYIPRQAQPPPPLPNIGKWEQQPSTDGSKRGSGSSQSTENSSDYSPDASSPATPYGSSDSSLGGYEMPYKVKVHFHEDIFVVSVPPRVEYADLVDKIGKKIRLCGPRRDDGPLRVKYQDEDGDMVSLGSTEDVQMAFESVRPGGLVTLFVT